MPQKTRIVIAEDHTILREGLKALISSHPEFEIAGEAKDGAEAIRSVNDVRPDLVLMDLSMPKMSGMSAIVEIKKRCPETKILVLTIHNMEEYILEALRAGANGYILKDADHKELFLAIKTVLEGKSFLSPSVSKKVIEGYLEGKKSIKTDTSWETLTQREREILKLIAEGYKNKEIANLLFISAKTVEKHRANLMKKLDIHNVQSLTAFAIERGLISE
ncbi:MAG: response regulator transcription factor [Deltaproteobacteria bacterium]|uniref:Response regulator transcription factor n=1 Tax=Candidatus Zymogenus saltonus TaxID=2844893 RepID=A0A9D8KFA1_9DELT|nr:response regulator transcription factor [Candidatus Zymogenus saltonus]